MSTHMCVIEMHYGVINTCLHFLYTDELGLKDKRKKSGKPSLFHKHMYKQSIHLLIWGISLIFRVI